MKLLMFFLFVFQVSAFAMTPKLIGEEMRKRFHAKDEEMKIRTKVLLEAAACEAGDL